MNPTCGQRDKFTQPLLDKNMHLKVRDGMLYLIEGDERDEGQGLLGEEGEPHLQ